MRKAQIAELILSLFTSRERAASTVGDLMENAAGRDAWWFWSAVFRTAWSLSWVSFAAEPFFIAGIGFRALVLNLSLYLALFICMLVFAGLFGLIAGLHVVSLSTVNNSSPGILRWVFRLLGGISAFAVQFQTGRWIARRARNREMAACLAFLIVQTIIMPIIGEILFGGRWLGVLTNASDGVPAPDITSASIMVSSLMSMIALIAGAIWVRYRSIEGATL
jgi:hypothetical protein